VHINVDLSAPFRDCIDTWVPARRRHGPAYLGGRADSRPRFNLGQTGYRRLLVANNCGLADQHWDE